MLHQEHIICTTSQLSLCLLQQGRMGTIKGLYKTHSEIATFNNVQNTQHLSIVNLGDVNLPDYISIVIIYLFSSCMNLLF